MIPPSPSAAASTATTPSPRGRSSYVRWLLTFLFVALVMASLFRDAITTGAGLLYLAQRLQTFSTIFLGIFIEAAPFLLAGSIVSGFIAIFVNDALIQRLLPNAALPAALSGAALGLLFPVCECGVVPVTRRLYEKGLPMSVGIAFLLAAPVVNPVVILSTYAAFGWGAVFWGRIAISFAVATIVGLVFHFARPNELLRAPLNLSPLTGGKQEILTPQSTRIAQALNTAGDDFLDMARYLIIGSLLAAAMQTLVPQSALLAVGQGPVTSVLTMQALAFVLSICSTVDAFLALAFSSSFTTGSIISFLTFGPMVDIKSALMFFGVFQRRIVFYLILLPLLLTMLVGLFWNLNIGL